MDREVNVVCNMLFLRTSNSRLQTPRVVLYLSFVLLHARPIVSCRYIINTVYILNTIMFKPMDGRISCVDGWVGWADGWSIGWVGGWMDVSKVNGWVSGGI